MKKNGIKRKLIIEYYKVIVVSFTIFFMFIISYLIFYNKFNQVIINLPVFISKVDDLSDTIEKSYENLFLYSSNFDKKVIENHKKKIILLENEFNKNIKYLRDNILGKSSYFNDTKLLNIEKQALIFFNLQKDFLYKSLEIENSFPYIDNLNEKVISYFNSITKIIISYSMNLKYDKYNDKSLEKLRKNLLIFYQELLKFHIDVMSFKEINYLEIETVLKNHLNVILKVSSFLKSTDLEENFDIYINSINEYSALLSKYPKGIVYYSFKNKLLTSYEKLNLRIKNLYSLYQNKFNYEVQKIYSFLYKLLFISIFLFFIFLFVAYFYGIYFANKIIKPILHLSLYVKNFVKTSKFKKCNLHTNDEIEDLSNNFNNMQLQIIAEIKKNEVILSSIVNPIISVNEYGDIDFCNLATESFFNYKYSDLTQKNIKQLIIDKNSKSNKENNFCESNIMSFFKQEMLGVKKSGRVFPIFLTVGQFKINDNANYIVVIHDLTEAKIKEQELNDSNKKLKLENLRKDINTELYENIKYIDNIYILSKFILKFCYKHFDFILSSLFYIDKDEKNLEVLASFGDYNISNDIKTLNLDGVFKHCFETLQKVNYVKNNQKYTSFPLILNNKVIAVLNFCLNSDLDEYKENLFYELSNIIAMTLNLSKGKDNLKKLLATTQKQALSLLNQEKLLIINNSSLKLKSDDLKRSEKALQIANSALRSQIINIEDKKDFFKNEIKNNNLKVKKNSQFLYIIILEVIKHLDNIKKFLGEKNIINNSDLNNYIKIFEKYNNIVLEVSKLDLDLSYFKAEKVNICDILDVLQKDFNNLKIDTLYNIDKKSFYLNNQLTLLLLKSFILYLYKSIKSDNLNLQIFYNKKDLCLEFNFTFKDFNKIEEDKRNYEKLDFDFFVSNKIANYLNSTVIINKNNASIFMSTTFFNDFDINDFKSGSHFLEIINSKKKNILLINKNIEESFKLNYILKEHSFKCYIADSFEDSIKLLSSNSQIENVYINLNNFLDKEIEKSYSFILNLNTKHKFTNLKKIKFFIYYKNGLINNNLIEKFKNINNIIIINDDIHHKNFEKLIDIFKSNIL